MNRNQTARSVLLFALTLWSAQLCFATSIEEGRFFPAGLLHADWQEFDCEGYAHPVTGVIYRGKPRPTCGMPLGGIDTGCLDIETNGLLGYSTIFNHLVNPRLLYNVPFLGLSVGGEARVLASNAQGKQDRPVSRETAVFPPLDYSPAFFDTGLRGVKFANSIDYFGHYPVLDMEFDTDLPVHVGMRAWSPMLPGDTRTSLLPGIVFEFRLRNPTDEPRQGTLVFSFPGYDSPNQKQVTNVRQQIDGELHGVKVATDTKGDARERGYVLASMNASGIRVGGPLGVDGRAWNSIEARLPATSETDSGATLAIDFKLQPDESLVRRVVLAWHAPYWASGGSPQAESQRAFTHMYAKHYASAEEAANYLAKNHEQLLKRVIAWQDEIYGDRQIPGWLADCLINNLHLITETSVWGQGKGPLDQFGEEYGLFALNECPRGCPQLECIPCSFYGNMPIVYFFPDAALSTLRGYREYQFADGRPPWIFGGYTASDEQNKDPYDLAAPDKGYQTVLNAACYIVMADRLWRATGDESIPREFYESLKRANNFAMNLRPKFGLSQVVSMPKPGTDGGGLGDTEWFEAPEPGWKGYVTHAGGVRMAQIQIMKRMAETVGDAEYVEKCDAWLNAGGDVLENVLWNGQYYLNFSDPETKQRSDLIFGYQLDGEWIADVHGVPGVFPKNRIDTTLATIRGANCKLSQTGATNYANPDGSPAKVGGYGTYGYFPPELMMLAMNYIYEGEEEFGIDLLRRCMENVTCTWGYTWDAPNTIRGDMDTGQRHFGADYYQNMMLWFLPAALAKQDMTGPLQEGGLVNRVIRAARGETR
ncbi:MAG: GH116 family glycosyl-hydrolase [Pirellulales bacterium]